MIGLDPHIEQALRDSESRIVVTGAGGWIGMATLECLSLALGLAFTRRVACFGSSLRTLTLLDGTQIEQRPLADIGRLAPRSAIVLHFAFLTKDRADAMAEAEYAAANRVVDGLLLESLDAIGAEAIFVASSGAAYRADDPTAAPAMRLYGALKLEQEQRFAEWAEARGKRAVIARIFNISGPHINKQDSYALAAFIGDALASRPIAIRSTYPVIRSYVAIRELMSLVFALLLDEGTRVVRFDSGGDPLELQQVGQIVADLLGRVLIERLPIDLDRSDIYVGDGATYRTYLDTFGIVPVPFDRQVIETANFLASDRGTAVPWRVAMRNQP